MDWDRTSPDYLERAFAARDIAVAPLREWLTAHGITGGKAQRIISKIVPYELPAARSPLEELFYIAISGPAFLRDLWIVHEPGDFQPYLPDFVIWLSTETHDEELIVELDGHDFHERTPDQAQHDKRRDRWFTARGHRVVRFTGREIVRDLGACIEETLAFFPPHTTTEEQ